MAEIIPRLLFVASLLIAAFLYGATVGHYGIFPYPWIRGATLTLQTAVDRYQPGPDTSVRFQRFADVDRGNTVARFRQTTDSGADEPLLVYGGMHQFREFCPDHGCLAVEFSRSRNVIHAYPYRPEEIFAANITNDYPYQAIDFDFAALVRPVGIERYPNGDLLVVFQGDEMFPFGAGVARVDRDGHPRWFRFDYSHHWPTLMDDGRALVPAMAVGERSIAVPVHAKETIRLDCSSNAPHQDQVRVLDHDGRVLRELSVLEAVLNSPHRAVLQQTTDPCDPTHLNYVQVASDEAAAAVRDLEPGDLIVSMRNISAFGFIDAEDGRLKRLVRGTFLQQHAVQHWRGNRFLMFDNHGGDAEGGPSQLLAVDLATGAEWTVFPTSEHPPRFHKLFSRGAGNVDVSPDRERALVVFSNAGKALEVRLVDGAVLTEFDHLHDVAELESLPEDRLARAAVFELFGLDYSKIGPDEAAKTASSGPFLHDGRERGESRPQNLRRKGSKVMGGEKG